jgi:hypothetical protein
MAQNSQRMQTIRDFIKKLKANTKVLALNLSLSTQSFVVRRTYFSQHMMPNCLRLVVSVTYGRIQKIYINNSSLCNCKMCSMPSYPKELTHAKPIRVCKGSGQRLLLLLLLLLFLSFYLCLGHNMQVYG